MRPRRGQRAFAPGQADAAARGGGAGLGGLSGAPAGGACGRAVSDRGRHGATLRVSGEMNGNKKKGKGYGIE